MKAINYDKITEMVKRKVYEAQRYTLLELKNDIIERINKRTTVMYSETGNEIRSTMRIERLEKTYKAKKELYNKNNEDFMIIGLIQKRTEELYKEHNKNQQ